MALINSNTGLDLGEEGLFWRLRVCVLSHVGLCQGHGDRYTLIGSKEEMSGGKGGQGREVGVRRILRRMKAGLTG